MGITIYMLTGDNRATAEAVASQVGIQYYKASVLPQGKAEFTMEFAKYLPVPRNIQEELIKKYGDKAKGAQR